MIDESFGKFVRQMRKQAGITQEALAAAMRVTKGYISQIENDNMPPTGEPPRVNPDKLDLLADALHLERADVRRRSWLGPLTDPVSPDEQLLLERYRNLGPRDRRLVDTILQGEGADAGEQTTLADLERQVRGQS